MHHSLRRALLAAALVTAIAVTAAACDDGDEDDDDGASQAAIATLTARVQRDEMFAGVRAIDELPLHEMADTIEEGTFEASFAPTTRSLVRVLALTDWGARQTDADALRGHAEELLAAIEANDIAKAKEHAPTLHEAAHQFSTDVWESLTAQMPGDAGGGGHDEMTPMSDHSASPTMAATP